MLRRWQGGWRFVKNSHVFLDIKNSCFLVPSFGKLFSVSKGTFFFTITLQETNISHLGKRKIIFKYALSGGYVNSLVYTSLFTFNSRFLLVEKPFRMKTLPNRIHGISAFQSDPSGVIASNSNRDRHEKASPGCYLRNCLT